MDPNDRFLPNDHTFQVDCKPNPQIFDNRGKLVEALRKELGVEHWRVGNNRLDIYDKPITKSGFVAYNQFGLTQIDTTDPGAFIKTATGFLSVVAEFPGFNDVQVFRIGAYSRFCTKFKGSFEQLRSAIGERYASISPAGMDAMGTSDNPASLVDCGVPFMMEDELGKFTTFCGPMKAAQLRNEQFSYKEEKDLPAVGLFFTVDYFLETSDVIPTSGIAELLTKWLPASWNKHHQVRALIVG